MPPALATLRPPPDTGHKRGFLVDSPSAKESMEKWLAQGIEVVIVYLDMHGRAWYELHQPDPMPKIT
jgi:hypothetical protein